MQVTGDIKQVRAIRWQDPKATWGVVPTMGYLHRGHLSLVAASKADNMFTAVTIYINPTQFAEGEDLDSYPRDIDHDLSLLEAAGVDLVFTPSNATMYPDHFQTKVEVGDLTQFLEGSSRPTHFHGVTTIVTKLLNIVQPTHAYFGQKDAQQARIIQQLVDDLHINTAVMICPIVRESDGLAFSSRNVYLSAAERCAAVVLSRSITTIANHIEAGIDDGDQLRAMLTTLIEGEPLAQIDYVSIADASILQELKQIDVRNDTLISVAVFFGRTRLIDNQLVASHG